MSILKQQTRQWVQQARRRLSYLIESSGMIIEWKEPVYESDGMNGHIKVRETTRTVRGILVNNSGGSVNSGNMNMTDSGRKEQGTHKLVILYDKEIKPEYLTEFYTHDNQQYRVVDVQDENNFHVSYVISCTHTKAYMPGYKNGE